MKAPFRLPVRFEKALRKGSMTLEDEHLVNLLAADHELIAECDIVTDKEKEYIVEAINFAGRAHELLLTLVEQWPEYDIPDGEDNNSISGADMVEWIDTYRRDVKALLASTQIEDEPAIDPESVERKIVIVMDGGIVQEVLSDHPGVDVAMVDYDVEGSTDVAIVDVPQGDETKQKAAVWFLGREVQPERVAELWTLVENANSLAPS